MIDEVVGGLEKFKLPEPTPPPGRRSSNDSSGTAEFRDMNNEIRFLNYSVLENDVKLPFHKYIFEW